MILYASSMSCLLSGLEKSFVFFKNVFKCHLLFYLAIQFLLFSQWDWTCHALSNQITLNSQKWSPSVRTGWAASTQSQTLWRTGTELPILFFLEFECLTQCLAHLVQFSSVAQLCLTLCDPMNCSTPGLPVYHQLPESTQTHVHWVGDAIQPSHPLSSPSPPALNLF